MSPLLNWYPPINHCSEKGPYFHSLFWLMRVPIGSLFPNNFGLLSGPYFKLAGPFKFSEQCINPLFKVVEVVELESSVAALLGRLATKSD